MKTNKIIYSVILNDKDFQIVVPDSKENITQEYYFYTEIV